MQQSSAPDNRSYASATSSANYGVSGNTLTVSLSQDLYIQEGGYLTFPYDPNGSATANGSVDLTLEIAGSGTGLAEVAVESVGNIDNAGEDGTNVGFSLAGYSYSCSLGYPDSCNQPPFPSIPFPLGTPFNLSMGESSFGFVDEGNPLSAVSGTTTFEFIFDPISVDPPLTDVPEPHSTVLVLAAALLLGCWRLLGRFKRSVILHRD